MKRLKRRTNVNDWRGFATAEDAARAAESWSWKPRCVDCGQVITDPSEVREHRCTACQFVQAHIDLAATVIGVPSRALRDVERRAS